MPVAPAPAPTPAPSTVLHIGNQNPSALASRNETRVTASFHRRAEAKELSMKLYSGPNTNLGKIINSLSDTLLYRFHLRLVDNHGQPIDSEGRRIPRPSSFRPARKYRYTEYKKAAKKTSSLRCRKTAENRSASSLMAKMRDEGKLSFAITKNWREFPQIERFSARIDFQDMIDRSTTYMYEREKKQFYSDPKNEDKPFYPRYLPIVVSRTKDIDDWRIKTGPNGQLIQPQIVMPPLSTNKYVLPFFSRNFERILTLVFIVTGAPPPPWTPMMLRPRSTTTQTTLRWTILMMTMNQLIYHLFLPVQVSTSSFP